MEKFAIGLVMGGVIGALLVANNNRMRAFVKKAQDETQAKLDAFMDEKIRNMEKTTDKIVQKSEEKVDDVKEKISKKVKKNAD